MLHQFQLPLNQKFCSALTMGSKNYSAANDDMQLLRRSKRHALTLHVRDLKQQISNLQRKQTLKLIKQENTCIFSLTIQIK